MNDYDDIPDEIPTWPDPDTPDAPAARRAQLLRLVDTLTPEAATALWTFCLWCLAPRAR